jgi:retron-type reverse transcriptase
VRALQHALYRTAKADPGRRFRALWDKVFRRDVLWRGWLAVRANNGAPGIDKITLDWVEREYGALRLVDDLAAELREGRYRPLPARGVMIPEPGLKDEYRPLAISAVRDRIVQAALKIVPGRSSRRTFCRAASGSARGGRRTTPSKSSSMRLGGAAGGWPGRTSPAVSRRFRTRS